MLVKGSHIFKGLCKLSSDVYKFGSFLKKVIIVYKGSLYYILQLPMNLWFQQKL